MFTFPGQPSEFRPFMDTSKTLYVKSSASGKTSRIFSLISGAFPKDQPSILHLFTSSLPSAH